MLKLDPAVTPIGMAGLLAVAIGIGAGNFAAQSGVRPEQIASPAFADTSAAPQWAASATGRVEPVNGEIRIAGQVPGKIVEVLAKTNDKVEAGDLLARLDDQEIYAKIAAASAETGVRERERQDEPPTGLAKERQDAEDAVANAERRLSSAREMFDAALRAVHASAGSPEKFADGRKSVQTAKAELEAARVALAAVRAKPEMPLETRLESSLAMARAELSAAEIALERTRIRAPASGTILNMIGKEGETAVPSPESALLIFGDLSSLRLRRRARRRVEGRAALPRERGCPRSGGQPVQGRLRGPVRGRSRQMIRVGRRVWDCYSGKARILNFLAFQGSGSTSGSPRVALFSRERQT